MQDLHEVIAQNLVDLRTARQMTQLDLATVLNYSDKAVSKWERGESTPDVTVLKQIADYFGVTVDYLLTPDHGKDLPLVQKRAKAARANRVIVTLLATLLVWLIATLAFSFLLIRPSAASRAAWLCFIYALPVSFIVLLVFNSIWGRKKKLNYWIISALTWTLLTAVFLAFLMYGGVNLWPVFVIGVPAQVMIILWSGLTMRKL